MGSHSHNKFNLHVNVKLSKRQILKEAYTQNDKIFSITINIGLHQITATDTIDQAIIIADTNLYTAKEQGRNRCVFNLSLKKLN